MSLSIEYTIQISSPALSRASSSFQVLADEHFTTQLVTPLGDYTDELARYAWRYGYLSLEEQSFWATQPLKSRKLPMPVSSEYTRHSLKFYTEQVDVKLKHNLLQAREEVALILSRYGGGQTVFNGKVVEIIANYPYE
jgi:hypothetical protein